MLCCIFAVHNKLHYACLRHNFSSAFFFEINKCEKSLKKKMHKIAHIAFENMYAHRGMHMHMYICGCNKSKHFSILTLKKISWMSAGQIIRRFLAFSVLFFVYDCNRKIVCFTNHKHTHTHMHRCTLSDCCFVYHTSLFSNTCMFVFKMLVFEKFGKTLCC